jgi:hypothetical protein
MSMDISEEAKEAIANGQLIRARNRLRKDGCSTKEAFRRRMLLLAAERNLPPAEYTKLFRKCVSMKPLSDFCKKHDVSLDWIMDGDLKGLQRMKKWEREGGSMSTDELKAELYRIGQVFLSLPHSKQKIAFDHFNQLATGSNSNA